MERCQDGGSRLTRLVRREGGRDARRAGVARCLGARRWRAAFPAEAMSRQSTLLRFFPKAQQPRAAATPPPSGGENRCRSSREQNGLEAAARPAERSKENGKADGAAATGRG